MNCNAQIKVEKQAILLENDVFLYKIPSGLPPGHCHKAKDWDISNPIGGYKLLVLPDDDSDSCHIQLKDCNGEFFGYGVIDCYPGLSGSTSTSSSSISPVADSSRYFTTKIRRLSSGQDELIGIGFISREDSLSLTKTLENYFTSGNQMPVPTYNAEESPAPAINDKVPSDLFQRKTPQYDCQFCSNSFGTAELCKEHIETRHKRRAPKILFYCDTEDCDKRFLSQLTLDNHKKIEHVGNPPLKKRKDQDHEGKTDAWYANIRDNLNDNPTGAAYHNALKNKFWCPICPSEAFTTSNENKLKEHMTDGKFHGSLKPRTCDYCSLMFNTVERFVRHTYIVHYKCSTCFRLYMDEVSLREHVSKSHKQQVNYKCHLCPKPPITGRQFFIEHYKTEHPDPAFDSGLEQPAVDFSPPDSPVSQHTLDRRESRRMRHVSLENPPSPKRIKCDDNDDQEKKSFEKEKECNIVDDNLVDNSKGEVYHDELKKKFWCPLCPPQAFTTTDRKELFQHLRQKSLHGERRPRLCDICFLMFKNEELFLDHVHLLHFPCPFCTARLRTAGKLDRHVLKMHNIQKGTLMYPCHRCPSNFTDHDSFVKHLKTEHSLNNHKRAKRPRREDSPSKERVACEDDAVDPIGEQPATSSVSLDTSTGQNTDYVENDNHKRKKDIADRSPTKRIKCEDEEETETSTDDLVDYLNGAVFHNEDKSLFWCPICPSQSFTTTDRKELLKHFKFGQMHAHENPRVCGICSLVFKNVDLYKYHLNVFHFICAVCSQPFIEANYLKRHLMKVHKQTLTYKCHLCPSNFTNHALFVRHLKTEHPPALNPRKEESGNEPLLEDTPVTENTLDREERERASDIRLDLLADNPDGAVYHNEDKTLFWCPICPSKMFTFPHEKALMNHMKRRGLHGSLTPRACKHCSLMFNSVQRLDHHKNLVHFTCSNCLNEVFTNEDDLRSHVSRSHNQPLIYKCHLCYSRFAVHEDFADHYKAEHPLPPADPKREQPKTLQRKRLKCGEKQDSAETKLEREIRIANLVENPNGAVYHDELKTLFWCPICPSQSFATVDKITLFKHLRDKKIHGPVRYRVCGVCSLMFNNMADFQYHANIFHYACPTCFVTLPNEDRLKFHVSEIHEDKLNYRCHLCPSSFTNRELFVQHLKTEHPRPNGPDPGGEQPSISLPVEDQEPPVNQLKLDNLETYLEERLENSPIMERIKCEGALDEDEITGKELTVELNSLVDNPNGAVYHDELKTTFWCPICPAQSFTTSDKKALFKHLKDKDIHGNGQPRICGICSLMFNNLERFLYHANIFHFTCSVCMISFKDDEDKLRRHASWSHQQELCYECHRCLSSFTDHALFVEHLKTEHSYPPTEAREEESYDEPLPEDAPVSHITLDDRESMEDPENPPLIPIREIKCEDIRDPGGEQSDINVSVLSQDSLLERDVEGSDGEKKFLGQS